MKFGVQVNCYDTTWDDSRRPSRPWRRALAQPLVRRPLPAPGKGGAPHRVRGIHTDLGRRGHDAELRLGHLVLGNTYRNPALVAKMAATLDQASRGRFTLALGAAWFSANTRPTAGISHR